MKTSLGGPESLNMDRYAETFGAFLEYSLEYDLVLNCIKETLSKIERPFSMLDIGAGTGEIIGKLGRTPGFVPTRYEAFEPNPLHLAKLLPMMESLPIDQKSISDHFFDSETHPSGQFDFILFSHSLYWMDDPAMVFAHAFEFLEPNGCLMGILQGPYGVHTLLALFESRIQRTTPMLQNNAYSSFELMEGLRERGLRPSLNTLPTPLDMTGLFREEKTEALHELMSFCLQVEFSELAVDLQSDILSHVQGGLVPIQGRSLWFIPNAVVTLVKPIL